MLFIIWSRIIRRLLGKKNRGTRAESGTCPTVSLLSHSDTQVFGLGTGRCHQLAVFSAPVAPGVRFEPHDCPRIEFTTLEEAVVVDSGNLHPVADF